GAGVPVDDVVRAVDLDGVAGDADDPLDDVPVDVAGLLEHDDVAPLGRVQVVGELVGEEQVVVLQRRDHARAVDAHRLQADGDDDVEGDRESEHLEEVADQLAAAAAAAASPSLTFVRRRRGGLGGRGRIGELRHRARLSACPGRGAGFGDDGDSVASSSSDAAG